MALLVADRGVADQIFSRRPDDGCMKARTQPRPQPSTGFFHRQSPKVGCGQQAYPAVIDQEQGRVRALAGDDNGVATRLFGGQREMGRGQSIIQPIGER